MTMQFPLDLIATTAFGLEAIAKRELAQLGYESTIIGPGWIRFQGDVSAICRANLWLRVVDRVLVQIATFRAEDFDTLFETTKAWPWHEWLGADAAIHVTGRSIKSQLSSVPACQRAVKKAIVESLMAAHRTESLPETGPRYKVEVAILKNQVTLTLDTTGPSLHKRGYRQRASSAPLKETLAAAMVLLSFWKPERPMIDPFCGSGTIPIEAALIGRNLAPGLARTFAAESWPNLDATTWAEARAEARDLMQPKFDEPIVGTDIDKRSLDFSRHNATAAGVLDQIHFQQRPFDRLSSKRKFGCVVTNPPYGQRLGTTQELESLYLSIPVVLRGLPTWSHFILTAFPDFESLLQKQADRRRKLYNGRIECTYYQFHGPNPNQEFAEEQAVGDDLPIDQGPGQPASNQHLQAKEQSRHSPLSPVFGGLTAKAREQAELLGRRLRKRAHHLRRWPAKQGITCFRIYDRDIPEVPLVIDRYEDHLHIAEYERPHDRDVAQHADWLDLMAHTAAETLGIEYPHVFFKQRRRQRGTTQHEHLAHQHYEITVNEGGLRFIVNLSDYLDTGLFLDHRIARAMFREKAAGANVLNLFAYTGSFSVYAAAGGAARTTTVDWSHAYLDWAGRNMALNGFSGSQHRLVRDDARAFLTQHPQLPLYDLAVVDPPTFSNSKRTEQDWDIQTDYVDLLNRLLRLIKPNGIVFFSTNFRRFKFDSTAIADATVREISRQTVPPDFRNRRIHRCWHITKHSDQKQAT